MKNPFLFMVEFLTQDFLNHPRKFGQPFWSQPPEHGQSHSVVLTWEGHCVFFESINLLAPVSRQLPGPSQLPQKRAQMLRFKSCQVVKTLPAQIGFPVE